jgi:hypothetical protein
MPFPGLGNGICFSNNGKEANFLGKNVEKKKKMCTFAPDKPINIQNYGRLPGGKF